jgi:hypothetical protein
MKRAAIFVVLGALVAACPPSALTPSITVTSSPHTLTISGTGFANVSPCVILSLQGAPPPSSNVTIGKPQCSGGSFQNFVWQYSRDGDGCSGAQAAATVFAVDIQGSTAGTSQNVSIDAIPENCGNRCCSADQQCVDPFNGVCCALGAGPACGHTADGLGGWAPGRCCAPNDTCTTDACCSSEIVCGSLCLLAGWSCCDDFYPQKVCGPDTSCCGDICCRSGTHCRFVAGTNVCSPV